MHNLNRVNLQIEKIRFYFVSISGILFTMSFLLQPAHLVIGAIVLFGFYLAGGVELAVTAFVCNAVFWAIMFFSPGGKAGP